MKQYLRPVAQTSFGAPDSFRPFPVEPVKPKAAEPTLPFGVHFDAARYGFSDRFNLLIASRHMHRRHRYMTPTFPAGFIAANNPDMLPANLQYTDKTPVAFSYRHEVKTGWRKRFVYGVVSDDGGLQDLQKIELGIVAEDTPRIQLINEMSDWAYAVTQMPGYVPAMRRDFSMLTKANLVDEHALGLTDNEIGKRFNKREIAALGLTHEHD